MSEQVKALVWKACCECGAKVAHAEERDASQLRCPPCAFARMRGETPVVPTVVAEIMADVAQYEVGMDQHGVIRTFGDLHDYCDANEYFMDERGAMRCTTDEQQAVMALVNERLGERRADVR